MQRQHLFDKFQKGLVPDDPLLQIKQVEAVIEQERRVAADAIPYPFRFENGRQIVTPAFDDAAENSLDSNK